MSDNGSVPNIPGAKKYEKSYNHPLSRGKWDALEGGVRIPLLLQDQESKMAPSPLYLFQDQTSYLP